MPGFFVQSIKAGNLFAAPCVASIPLTRLRARWPDSETGSVDLGRQPNSSLQRRAEAVRAGLTAEVV